MPWDASGDLLFLFTDGLPDALPRRDGGRPEDLVVDTVVRHRFASPQEIIEALFELAPDRSGERMGDDRTALVLRL
jgi:serine phosphatase RsbU (regulator of sigma subunit)